MMKKKLMVIVFVVKITYWDLVSNKCLSMMNDVHPPGFGVLNVKVSPSV